jgi:hypothetical protein
VGNLAQKDPPAVCAAPKPHPGAKSQPFLANRLLYTWNR